MSPETTSYKPDLRDKLAEISVHSRQKEGIVELDTPKPIEKPSDEEMAKAFASYPE